MHKVYMNLEKGGTGRTLTLYHLAWTLGDLFNKRVLIVDLDAQKNISFLFGVKGDDIVANGGCSIAHCLAKNLNQDRKRKSIRECIVKDVAPNVDIAYSSFDIMQVESSIVQEINRHLILNNVLDEVKDDYDYVFFDTDGNYNQLCINSIVASDLILATMKTDFQNLQSFLQTMSNLQSLAEEGVEINLGGVVCTTYESNTLQSNQCVSYLEENDFEIWAKIKKQVSMQDSAMYNMPIYKFAPSNQGSWGIIRLAHRLLDYFGEDFTIPLDKKYKRKKDV